ncbi:Tektin [Sergentomyia squamirostris]
MKWQANSFLENRIFDCRLVKDNLINSRGGFGGALANHQRCNYRAFQESYPWSSASGPDQRNESGYPQRVGSYYQTPRPHPWRPTMGYETIELAPIAEHPLTNQLVHPNYTPPSLTSEPLSFPNLVTAYEKNPQHAARTALYTRYTPSEWINSCISTYAEADVNRHHSERLRSEALRLMRETDEKTAQSQREAGRRIGERITDVTFWRNELNTELEKLIAESAILAETKKSVQKALEDTGPPLNVAQECLYHREGRMSIEKVHDHVEKSLLVEIDNLRASQEKLKALHDKICKQLSDCRSAQFALEDDLAHKESTLGIDTVCHQLSNSSRGINYYGGIEKYDPTISTVETWASASSHRINRSQTERGKSSQLRSDSEAMMNAVSTAVWDCWSNSNNSLNKRAAEMMEAKNRVQLHLHKTQQEIFDIEKNIELLRKAVQDKSNPLKVAQTRLEARSHRNGLEICKDMAHVRLVQEVCEIQDSVSNLHRKLQDAEMQHQQLLKTKANLENDLKNKTNALFIDREKCMGIRRSFPVHSLIKY